jgi:tetratricopeptide (TPR) repeat protein
MTFAYAAPEFFRGETSGRSDQYSLAVTYCHLRGGRLPFHGNDAQLMAGHLGQPPDLTMLPPEERVAVARALAKDPDDRWPSCRDFVDAVRVGRVSGPVTPAWSPPPPASLPLPPSPSGPRPTDPNARAAGTPVPGAVSLPKSEDPPATDRPEVFFLRLKELLRLHDKATPRGHRGKEAVLLFLSLALIWAVLLLFTLSSVVRVATLAGVNNSIGEALLAGLLIVPVLLALKLALWWYKRPQLRVARLIERIAHECPGQLREWGGADVLREATVVRDMTGEPDPGGWDQPVGSTSGLVSPCLLPDLGPEPLTAGDDYASRYAPHEVTAPPPARPRGCLRRALKLVALALGAPLVVALVVWVARPGGWDGGRGPQRVEGQAAPRLPNGGAVGGWQQPPDGAARAHHNLGYSHLLKAEYKEAIREYSAVLRITPGDAAAYNNRGYAYLMAGSPDMAVDDCTTAIKQKPAQEILGRAYCNRSIAYGQMGEFTQCRDDYDRAIHIDPKFEQVWKETRNMLGP